MSDADSPRAGVAEGSQSPLPQAPVRADDLLGTLSGQPLTQQLETLERIADVLGSDLGKAR